MPTYRTAAVDTIHNDEELRLNLDLMEEKWERAAICEAKANIKMIKYYNTRVRGVAFWYWIFTKGQKQSQTRQNQARNWKEREKPRPK
ncbi:hypothetical protein Tco_1171379, partial [Tanacetum coccineum]